MDPQSIAQTFITQYYQMFDTNRAALGSLYVSKLTLYELARYHRHAKMAMSEYNYVSVLFLLLKRPESVMWFEGTCTQGATAIDKKLTVRLAQHYRCSSK